jgi:hypothetical protein
LDLGFEHEDKPDFSWERRMCPICSAGLIQVADGAQAERLKTVDVVNGRFDYQPNRATGGLLLAAVRMLRYRPKQSDNRADSATRHRLGQAVFEASHGRDIDGLARLMRKFAKTTTDDSTDVR